MRGPIGSAFAGPHSVECAKLFWGKASSHNHRNHKLWEGARPEKGNTKLTVSEAEMITERECTPAGVWIFGRSRSQYFRFEPEQEPESTLRSVQELIKYFKGPVKISVIMIVVFKQNGNNWDVFSDQRRHISQRCDTGWEYRVVHHYWWFQMLVPMRNAVCKWL